MSPIHGLTNRAGGFIRLGKIRKGERDAKGNPKDLEYFRTTFEDGCDDVRDAFLKVYGEKPTRINARLAFPEVKRVWDAFYVCYETGGQAARAGSNENGLYWVWYRDHATKEIWVRDGRPLCREGVELMAKPIDIREPVYVSRDGNENFLKTEGCLKLVIPELAQVNGKNRVGFFEFRPISPADIGTISSELNGMDEMAEAVGRDITGIPIVLSRRREMVTKKIKGVLSKGPAWVVHVEVGGEWAGKALEYMAMKALPGDVVDGEVIPEDDEPFIDEPKLITVGSSAPADEWEPPDFDEVAKPEKKKTPTPMPSSAQPPAATGEVPLTRPYSPAIFKAKLVEMIATITTTYEEKKSPLTVGPNDGKILASIIDQIYGDKGPSRHIACTWLIGTGSTKEMTAAQIKALFHIMGIKGEPRYESVPSAESIEEFRLAYQAASAEAVKA